MAKQFISEFRKRFKIDAKADLRDVVVVVESIYNAFDIASNYIDQIVPGNDSSLGFRLHTTINLLGRNFEHAQAMLVALATGSPASSEALARIVVEGSINLIYLSNKSSSGTLILFFREWLQEHKKKLTAWQSEIKGQSHASWTMPMISERSAVVDSLVSYVDGLEAHLDLKTEVSDSKWPKSLFARFEELGRQSDYYTTYHRLSGASHITAEDTLTWLISLDMPDDLKHKLGIEAWAYSTMMVRIASIFFVDAALACVVANGRVQNEDLQKCKIALAKAAEEISKLAGAPQMSIPKK